MLAGAHRPGAAAHTFHKSRRQDCVRRRCGPV